MKQGFLGAHVSAAGGLYKAIENAEKIGAGAVQIFGSSPRQWKVREIPKEDIVRFLEAKEKSAIKRVYIHAPYLINLASPDKELVKKSIDNFVAQMKIGEQIKADGVVVHVGSATDGDQEKGLKRSIINLKKVLDKSPGSTRLLIENAASTKRIGSDISEIAEMVAGLKSKRVAVCFDTAYAFAAGLLKTFSGKELTDFLKNFNTEIGLEKLVLIHGNDSKAEYESNRDRHENLGKGYIGLPAFKALAKEKKLRHADWTLEVPGFKNEGPDKKNMDILKKCFA